MNDNFNSFTDTDNAIFASDDTGNESFANVNDTVNAFIASVIDTGDASSETLTVFRAFKETISKK
jgi:adenine-specific DNA methylase